MTDSTAKEKAMSRAYLVTISMGVSAFRRLVLTPDADAACRLALEDVFATERQKWAEEDRTSENPFWVTSLELVARNDAFDDSSGIITT